MINFDVSVHPVSNESMLLILADLQQSRTTIDPFTRQTRTIPPSLLRNVQSQLDGPHTPVSTEFSRRLFAGTVRDSSDPHVLFIPSPVDCIDSVDWAVLQGRLDRQGKKCERTGHRLAEAALMLTGIQFHAIISKHWALAQLLFFGGELTRWTVVNACANAHPLVILPEHLHPDADPNLRAVHLLAAALQFAVVHVYTNTK